MNPIAVWLGRSFLELGFKELQALTSGTLLGWSWIAVSPDLMTQTRSIFEAFLRRALNETHDRILYQMTLAQKILFEEGRAGSVIIDTVAGNGGTDAIFFRTDNTSPHRHIRIVLL